MTDTAKPAGKPFDPAHFLRNQLRNIAPLITLISLFLFFSIASPSFVTLDNFANILAQVSLTSIIAVGLTFVILTGEIDLSVAAVANAMASSWPSSRCSRTMPTSRTCPCRASSR
jgi:ribose transport system permease protein